MNFFKNRKKELQAVYIMICLYLTFHNSNLLVKGMLLTVVPEPNSKLIEVIKRSEKIKSLIKDEYENIVNGKYKNKYLENGLAFEIPNSESDSWLDEMNLFGVLHNMDIFDIKRTNNRSIEFVISDFYDFEYWSIQKDDDFKNMVIKKINNNANSQQSKGRLKPYVLYIPIEIKYEELKDILSKK